MSNNLEQAGAILKSAPMEWQALADSLTAVEASVIANHLDEIISRATILSVYLRNYRADAQSHEVAVRQANTKRAQVRKVLGFANPRGGEGTW